MSDRTRHPPPFSVRLSVDERARLEREANGVPLGAYIRQRLLGPTTTPILGLRRKALTDRAALSHVIALLGQSRVASNLNQLAKAAHLGTLPIDEELARDLREAVDHVAAMRGHLLTALKLADPRGPAGDA